MVYDRLSSVRAEADELWGIEPDTSVRPRPGSFDNFQNTLFEDANIPDDSVDFAYSCMVMEHVRDPRAFMSKVYRVLKPGGSYMFLTVNGGHYFAQISNTLRKLALDEWTLRLVRSRQLIESYHYPTAYKFNTPSQIGQICRELGFEPPRYIFAEHEGAKYYFPGPAVLFWHLMIAKRRMLQHRENLLELICWIRKP